MSTPQRTSESFIQIGEAFHTVAEARTILGVPEHACFGCYLGDDGPSTHDECPIGEWQ